MALLEFGAAYNTATATAPFYLASDADGRGVGASNSGDFILATANESASGAGSIKQVTMNPGKRTV